MHIQILKLGLFLLIGMAVIGVSHAADFRVDNRTFSGDGKETAYRSCTIFHQGVVYSFLQDPAETIIFDKAAGRFVLLDDSKKVRSELTTTGLDSFMLQLKERALMQQDAVIRFLAEPTFEERFDSTRRELTLASDLVSYRAIITSADNAAMAAQYREFSDWYARLNASLIPGSRPPFARLQLNEAIARREAIAREVILSITTLKDGKRQTTSIRSEHSITTVLSPADMERIEHAKQSISSFKPVSFEKYRQAK
jgi:hypothetical protein